MVIGVALGFFIGFLPTLLGAYVRGVPFDTRADIVADHRNNGLLTKA